MAYLGVDVGGSKTLVAVLGDEGVILEDAKFPTPKDYSEFLDNLKATVSTFKTKDFKASGVALPGVIDREKGIGIAFGNLPWKHVTVKSDIEKLTGAPVAVENDANLAGLSEAMLLKSEYKKVLYITISTGIGGGIIVNGVIDPYFANSEPGHMVLENNGSMKKWEDFASGRAIVEEYGKRAEEITDPVIWRKIAANLAQGLLDLMAILQPEVIIIGGGVGTYFDRFGKLLVEELNRYYNPLVPIPPIRPASRPELAVVYGCYDLAKAIYGNVHS